MLKRCVFFLENIYGSLTFHFVCAFAIIFSYYVRWVKVKMHSTFHNNREKHKKKIIIKKTGIFTQTSIQKNKFIVFSFIQK